MSAFKDYAQYYDFLYRDKDYEIDCDYLERIFDRYAPEKPQTILELGCGTGGHTLPLTRRGYQVTGVDCSVEMLAQVKQKAAALPKHFPQPAFEQADIRSLDLNQKFDAVVSMFGVLSYMTTNNDLLSSLHAARRHLLPKGLFIFDVWYGPAVLIDRPADRYKIVEHDGERIIRFVHPELDVINHTVQVNYTVLRLNDSKVMDETFETHILRFMFPQEIIHYLEDAGFHTRKLCPVLQLDSQLNERDWNMSVISEAR